MNQPNQCNDIDSSAVNLSIKRISVHVLAEKRQPQPSQNHNLPSSSGNYNSLPPTFQGNLISSTQKLTNYNNGATFQGNLNSSTQIQITNYNNGTLPSPNYSMQPSNFNLTQRPSGNFNSYQGNITMASDVPPNYINSNQIIRTSFNGMAPVAPSNFTHMPIESANYNPVPGGYNQVPVMPSNFNRLQMQPNFNSVPLQSASCIGSSNQNYRSLPPQNFNQTLGPNFNYAPVTNNNMNREMPSNNMIRGPNFGNVNGRSVNLNGSSIPRQPNGGMIAGNLNGGSNTVNLNGRSIATNGMMPPQMNNRFVPPNLNSSNVLVNVNGGYYITTLNGQLIPVNITVSANISNINGGLNNSNINGGLNNSNINGEQIPANMNISPFNSNNGSNLNMQSVVRNSAPNFSNNQFVPANLNVRPNINDGQLRNEGIISNGSFSNNINSASGTVNWNGNLNMPSFNSNMTSFGVPNVNSVTAPDNLNRGSVLVNMNGVNMPNFNGDLVQANIRSDNRETANLNGGAIDLVKKCEENVNNNSVEANISYESITDNSVEEYVNYESIADKLNDDSVKVNTHCEATLKECTDETVTSNSDNKENDHSQIVNLSEKPVVAVTPLSKPKITIISKPTIATVPKNSNQNSPSSASTTISKPNYRSSRVTACRMSWFLIKQENTEKYSIVHAVDILENYTDIYLNRKIKYNADKCTLYGTVVSASDDHKFIEEQLNILKPKSIIRDLSSPTVSTPINLWFLLQYTTRQNNIIHYMCNINKITSICGQPLHNNNVKEVLVHDGDRRLTAKVLYRAPKENMVLDEFVALRTKTIDMISKTILTDDDDDDSESDDNSSCDDGNLFEPWLLVQYSDDVNKNIYATFSEIDTIWKNENLYQSNIVYFEDKEQCIYQAIILKRSSTFHNISKTLKDIKDDALSSKFPMTMNNIDTNTDYSLVN